MLITEISKFQSGHRFHYNGNEALVTYVRPPYPDDILSIEGKQVAFPDKSLAITFKIGDKQVCLCSRIDAKMIKDGKIQILNLENYDK